MPYDEDGNEREATELEKEFQELVDEVHSRIFEKLSEASTALREAMQIADEHGVSFDSNISFLSQTYKADLLEKFKELDSEFVQEVTDCYGEYDGWQHSSVC